MTDNILILVTIVSVIISADCECTFSSNQTLKCDNLIIGQNELELYQNVESVEFINNVIYLANITSVLPNIKKLIVKSNESTLYPFVSDKLEILDLQNNKLNNLRNNTFENLTKLEILLLSNNELTSVYFTLPETIRVLNLSHNNINNLTNIWGVGTNLEVLNLSNNSLNSVEWNVFKNCLKLQTLNLENNKITQLISDNTTQLVSLVQLYLSGNKLTSLPPDFLSNTIDLKLLDLSQNRINTIEYNSLQKLNNLIHLNLSYNRLNVLEKHTFPYQLTTVDLSHNEISHINPGLFSLEYLSQVYLNDNKIKYFEDDTFAFQYPDVITMKFSSKIKKLDIKNNNLTVLSENFFFMLQDLEWIDFGGNPWFCDHLNKFIKYLNMKKVEYNKIGYFEGELPNCVKKKGRFRKDDWYRKKYFDKLASIIN